MEEFKIFLLLKDKLQNAITNNILSIFDQFSYGLFTLK